MVMCLVDGCGREARYKAAQLCQKHYFRKMRNGTTELKRSRKYRLQNPAGYQRIYEPLHKLAGKDGYVYEHRFVIYSKYGDYLPSCELCRTIIDWNTCHIDHIDNDVTNNNLANLRPLCRTCNTRREYPPLHTFKNAYAITFEGETKTPREWMRDPRVKVSNATIIRRKHAGMSDFDCLFSPKLTHNGNKWKNGRRVK